MAAAIALGDARAKTKTALNYQSRDGQLYKCELPILVDGVERGFLSLEYFVPDELTATQVRTHLAGGLFARWIAS